MKNKNLYDGYVINNDGASITLPRTTSIQKMERFARAHYGKGWTCVINRLWVDNSNGWLMQDAYGSTSEEVKRFEIRS